MPPICFNTEEITRRPFFAVFLSEWVNPPQKRGNFPLILWGKVPQSIVTTGYRRNFKITSKPVYSVRKDNTFYAR